MTLHVVTMLYDINRNKIDGRKKHFYLKYFNNLLNDLENTTQNLKISVFSNYPEHLLSDFTHKSNLKFDHKEYILTTIGQLNFFKFAITYNIINYAIEHINEIEKDMNETLKNR